MAAASACLSDKLSWSDVEYDIRQFVDKFTPRLPLIIRTMSGYTAASDPSLHEVGADEVLFFARTGGQGDSSPEFGVGSLMQIVFPDFVMLENFKDQIPCITFTMQKNVMPTMEIGNKLRIIRFS